MPDFAAHITLVSPSAGHQSKGVASSDERRTRTHARDDSQTSITSADDTPQSGCPTPQGSNLDKDLPDLPPISTGLWGSGLASEVLRSEVVCPPKEAGLIVTTSDVGCFAAYLPDSPPCNEASSKQTSLDPDDSDSEGCPSEIWSLLPITPTIRRIFASELLIAPIYSETKVLNGVDQDGPFSCPRRDCHDVLPTREAYNYHTHIHIIHDGLRLCELCGTRFIDDDHKEEHINSCSKLPAFDDLESFNAEPEPAGHLQSFLNYFHL